MSSGTILPAPQTSNYLYVIINDIDPPILFQDADGIHDTVILKKLVFPSMAAALHKIRLNEFHGDYVASNDLKKAYPVSPVKILLVALDDFIVIHHVVDGDVAWVIALRSHDNISANSRINISGVVENTYELCNNTQWWSYGDLDEFAASIPVRKFGFNTPESLLCMIRANVPESRYRDVIGAMFIKV